MPSYSMWGPGEAVLFALSAAAAEHSCFAIKSRLESAAPRLASHVVLGSRFYFPARL